MRETQRSDRFRTFEDFCDKAETLFMGLASQDPRHADLAKVYSFYVSPGGTMGGTDKRLLEVFYGSRPFDQVSKAHSSPNGPAGDQSEWFPGCGMSGLRSPAEALVTEVMYV